MKDLLTILLAGILANNYALGGNLGVANFLGFSEKKDKTLCVGLGVTAVMTVSAAICALLGSFLPTLGEEDLVLITADHGCDPGYTATTDHTREYVPLLILGQQVKAGNLGTRKCFADIAATVAQLLGVSLETPGESFAKEVLL